MPVPKFCFEVPQQSGVGKPQTMGPVFTGHHVWPANEKTPDHKIQPVFLNVWEGSEVSL